MIPEDQPIKPKTRKRKADTYMKMQVTGSNGKKYTIVAPKSRIGHIPKKWKWSPEKYRVAEKLADGIPIAQITRDPDSGVKTRKTIYAWLEHPEFRDHVDGLTLETGLASKRERIAGLKRVTEQLFRKISEEIDSLPLNDKNIGAILSNFQTFLKQLAQEKEEFVELQRVEQDTSIEGALHVATVNIEEFLKTKTDSERKQLEYEFDRIGDALIREATGKE